MQSLVTTILVTPPIKEIMASIYRGKWWQTSILKKLLHQKKLNPHRYTARFPYKIALQDSLRVWHWAKEPPGI